MLNLLQVFELRLIDRTRYSDFDLPSETLRVRNVYKNDIHDNCSKQGHGRTGKGFIRLTNKNSGGMTEEICMREMAIFFSPPKLGQVSTEQAQASARRMFRLDVKLRVRVRRQARTYYVLRTGGSVGFIGILPAPADTERGSEQKHQDHSHRTF